MKSLINKTIGSGEIQSKSCKIKISKKASSLFDNFENSQNSQTFALRGKASSNEEITNHRNHNLSELDINNKIN